MNYNIYRPEVIEYYNIHGTSRVLRTRTVCGDPFGVRASVTASNGRLIRPSKFPHNESTVYQGLMLRVLRTIIFFNYLSGPRLKMLYYVIYYMFNRDQDECF